MRKHMGCENMLEIQKLVDEGYISASNDQDGRGLTIYNYTKKTQFEGKWNQFTKWCRGMVIDDDLNVVIECPQKFFNMGEPEAPAASGWEPQDVVAQEKLDGYYISIRKDSVYGLIVTSRGSFSNQYVDAAKKLMPPLDRLETDVTYFCELCQTFPGDESLIVMRYDKPSLVLWGVSDRETGVCRPPMPYEGYERDWTVAKFVGEEVKEYMENEVEGIVVFNCKTQERVKVKTKWYLDMHRAINGVSKKNVIEALINNSSMSNMEGLPEEHLELVKKWEAEAQNKFKELRSRGHLLATKGLSPKEIAMTDEPAQVKTIAFAMVHNKDYVPIVWKCVKNELLRNPDNQ